MNYPLATGKDVGAYADAIDWKGKIIWMSPQKFLSLVRPLKAEWVNHDSMKNIEQRLTNNLPMDPLVLEVDMSSRKIIGHEGRHRAIKCIELGIKSVPVLVVTGSMYTRTPKWTPEQHRDVEDVINFIPENSLPSFKEFFVAQEAVKIDRFRKVRKSLDKVNKKKKQKKFIPGTFGFDIEFDYEENPDMTEEWRNYVLDNKDEFADKFREWLYTEHDLSFWDITEWEAKNPSPDRVLPMEEPNRADYDTDEEYTDAVEIWEDHQMDYENYESELEEWTKQQSYVEEQNEEWETAYDRQEYWKSFADDIDFEISNYIDFKDDSESRLNVYQNIIERKLQESTQREGDGENNYEDNWILSIDGGGQPEIASRILTRADIPVVRKLLSHLEDEPTSDGTSAHVHIGLPKDFDIFSLFALYGLVDEEYIKKLLPNRKFGDFANLSSTTINKIKNILFPVIGGNPLWKKIVVTDEGIRRTFLVSDEQKKMQDSYTLSFYLNEQGGVEDKTDETYLRFRKLWKDKKIEIVNKRYPTILSKVREFPNRFSRRGFMEIRYKYIDPEDDPVKWEEIPIVKDNRDRVVLDDEILDYVLNKITDKFSGINISYFKQRRTIEFRYLSSQILSDVESFLMFIEYFLRIPDIAMQARRINLNGIVLQKTDDGIAASISDIKY